MFECLDNTVTARWRSRLAGQVPGKGRHWRTRTVYYSAVSRLLADGKPRPAWSDIVAATRPKGSRTTFYEITGAHAKHSLIGELLAQCAVDATQLALYYRRPTAVDQLIDEAKVWTYWPYRERMSARCASDPCPSGEGLTDHVVATVRTWATGNHALARAVSHAPPICAVEDLLLLRPGRYSVVYAMGLLTRVIQGTTEKTAM